MTLYQWIETHTHTHARTLVRARTHRTWEMAMELSAPEFLFMVVLCSILGLDAALLNDAPTHERCDTLRIAASLCTRRLL